MTDSSSFTSNILLAINSISITNLSSVSSKEPRHGRWFLLLPFMVGYPGVVMVIPLLTLPVQGPTRLPLLDALIAQFNISWR